MGTSIRAFRITHMVVHLKVGGRVKRVLSWFFPQFVAEHPQEQANLKSIPFRTYRILHILPLLSLGGRTQVVLRNIEHSSGREFEHVVCYLSSSRLEQDSSFARAGITAICLDHHAGRGIRTLWRLVKIIRRHRIDLVHTNHSPQGRFYGQLAAMICRLPVVNTVHVAWVVNRVHGPSMGGTGGLRETAGTRTATLCRKIAIALK